MLLDVQNLGVTYRMDGQEIHAVNRLSFQLQENEIFGVVGESGCGKSSLIKALLRLVARNGSVVADSVNFQGHELLQMPMEDFRKSILWQKIALVPQSAMNSLNPVYKVGPQIVEAICAHVRMSEREARTKVHDLFESVGLQKDLFDSYPHQFSGGMRQRTMIAMALALDPQLIIMDEPTTGLDVLVQDKILKTLRRIKNETHCSMMIISHDIAIMSEIATRIGVMYGGSFVEIAPTMDLFKDPSHPYTMGLTNAFPSIRELGKELISIPGSPPVMMREENKCWFEPRCPFSADGCRETFPAPTMTGTNHVVSCLRSDDRQKLAKLAKEKTTWIS
jgi:peptide/nickel transport system ATP-binding protein